MILINKIYFLVYYLFSILSYTRLLPPIEAQYYFLLSISSSFIFESKSKSEFLLYILVVVYIVF